MNVCESLKRDEASSKKSVMEEGDEDDKVRESKLEGRDTRFSSIAEL